MAKPLTLQFAGMDLGFHLQKVDRARLYGYVSTETLDENGEACHLVTLADDGRTMMGSGGIALASLSPQGTWREKKTLRPVDLEGQALEPVPSSFNQVTALDTPVSVDDYLEHNIRAVYLLSSEEPWEELRETLEGGTIFSFSFSYRGSLQADTAFVLAAADGSIFMAVGQKADLHFVGFEPEDLPPAEEDEDEDDMDFGMM